MSDRFWNVMLSGSLGLIIVPLGAIGGVVVAGIAHAEHAAVAVSIAPVTIARDSSDRAILTATVTHLDDLHWRNFWVCKASLANDTPLELVSSFESEHVPHSFELAFATPAGASLPEYPVLSVQVGVWAGAWYLDRDFPTWSDHTLVFNPLGANR